MTTTILERQHVSFTIVWVVLLSYFTLTNSHEFEYLMLVLQWPKSYCRPAPNICKREPLPRNFTIHGLWPQHSKKTLYECQNKFTLKILESKPLLRMDASWTDLESPYTGGRSQNFWTQQYKKHGSCSWPAFTVEKYFLKALELKDRFDVLKILELGQIYPGILHSAEGVSLVITQATGDTPILKCQGEILNEVVICLDSSGTSVIKCPGSPYRGCELKIKLA